MNKLLSDYLRNAVTFFKIFSSWFQTPWKIRNLKFWCTKVSIWYTCDFKNRKKFVPEILQWKMGSWLQDQNKVQKYSRMSLSHLLEKKKIWVKPMFAWLSTEKSLFDKCERDRKFKHGPPNPSCLLVYDLFTLIVKGICLSDFKIPSEKVTPQWHWIWRHENIFFPLCSVYVYTENPCRSE